jgi:hypothetical protein
MSQKLDSLKRFFGKNRLVGQILFLKPPLNSKTVFFNKNINEVVFISMLIISNFDLNLG